MLICVDTELGAHVCAEGTSSHSLHEVVADVCADDTCNICSVECILGGILVATRSLWTPLAAFAAILLCEVAEVAVASPGTAVADSNLTSSRSSSFLLSL